MTRAEEIINAVGGYGKSASQVLDRSHREAYWYYNAPGRESFPTGRRWTSWRVTCTDLADSNED